MSLSRLGRGVTIREFRTPAGWVVAVFTPRGLRGLSFPRGNRAQAKKEALVAAQLGGPPPALPARWAGLSDSDTRPIEQALCAYWRGKATRLSTWVDLAGHPPFRKQVLTAAMQIPYGQTCSYSQLAAAAGNPKAARAVGNALAHNPVPPVAPCHRVIKADGSLGGFGGGLALKKRMLAMEKAALKSAKARR